MLKRLWDLTYWQFVRNRRICAGCGERRSTAKGRVNYGFAFDVPKKLYHTACFLVENRRRKNA
jgi:hypothetical protein